jgi:hypothetical protein
MDQCRSFGSSADSLHGSRGKTPLAVEAGVALGGNAINFPGNSRFKSSVAFMTMATSVEMVGREDLLTRDALVVSEEGPMGLRSAKELKGIIFHHFLFCKHESSTVATQHHSSSFSVRSIPVMSFSLLGES